MTIETKEQSPPPPTPEISRTALEAARMGADCSDKVFCITGAYSGIGVETVKALLAVGAKKIIIGGHNAQRQEEFVESLRKDEEGGYSNDVVEATIDATHTIDLADLESVQAFAHYVRATYPTIDVLICNAGIMNTPPGVTKNGIEQQTGVNVVGHFLLAKILAEQTKRQVWLSSYAHSLFGAPRFDLEYIKGFSLENDGAAGYNSWLAYQQSKLGNILVAREFQKRYKHLEVVSLHPGSIATNLSRYTTLKSVLGIAFHFLPKMWSERQEIGLKSVEAGAATTITCATLPSDRLVPGGYYMNCEEGGDKACAKNEDDAKALFEYCEELTQEFQ